MRNGTVQKDKAHLFVGGQDLEMVTIRDFARARLGEARVHDAGLPWGAKASVYAEEIADVLAAGETAILVELEDDLPADLPRDRLVLVDHHGSRAGAGQSSSLRQVFDLLGGRPAEWSRYYTLVEANDIGHMRALRSAGASPEEIREIRNADRMAQGVTEDDEREAKRAIANAEQHGALTVVQTTSSTSSAIGDRIEPEFGGPGADNLLVVMPHEISFFGEGAVVRDLAQVPGSWHGGALPERGFWGCQPDTAGEGKALVRRITELFAND